MPRFKSAIVSLFACIMVLTVASAAIIVKIEDKTLAEID
jgi:hypothetical protein